MPKPNKEEDGHHFYNISSSWSVKLLREYLDGKNLRIEMHVYDVSLRVVHAYFRKTAQKFAGNFNGRNPYSPHSLRVAFRTFLSDHKVDPLYIEFWMGHAIPKQQRAYIIKALT